MRVKTNQNKTFADAFIDIPSSELDALDNIINFNTINNLLLTIKTDYPAISLFKALLIGTWYNLSDERLASSLNRDLVFINFCGFSLSANKPDATTIGRFRTRLIKANLLDKLLRNINLQLQQKDLKLANGKYTTADATLIRSSRRSKKTFNTNKNDNDYEVDTNAYYSDDLDASWKYKSGKYTYGYQAIVTTDEQGLIESTTTKPANKSESKLLEEVVNNADIKEGKTLLYDKGVDSKTNRKVLKEHKLKDGIMRKKPKGKNYSYWNKLRNKLISKKRFVVERTFGTLKRTYGLSRARYIGIEKVAAEVNLKAIAYNLTRAVNVYNKRMQLP